MKLMKIEQIINSLVARNISFVGQTPGVCRPDDHSKSGSSSSSTAITEGVSSDQNDFKGKLLC